MADNSNPYDRFYSGVNKDKTKVALRDKYPNYQELLTYATKAAIELKVAKYAFAECKNAALL